MAHSVVILHKSFAKIDGCIPISHFPQQQEKLLKQFRKFSVSKYKSRVERQNG